MRVHKVFKRMISSSNFLAIAQLVVLARKDPWTASPFSSLLDPLPWLALCSPYELFLRKVNTRKESSMSKCLTSFKVSPSLTRPQSSSRNARGGSRGWWEGKRVFLLIFPPFHHTLAPLRKDRERDDWGRVRVPHVNWAFTVSICYCHSFKRCSFFN